MIARGTTLTIKVINQCGSLSASAASAERGVKSPRKKVINTYENLIGYYPSGDIMYRDKPIPHALRATQAFRNPPKFSVIGLSPRCTRNGERRSALWGMIVAFSPRVENYYNIAA